MEEVLGGNTGIVIPIIIPKVPGDTLFHKAGQLSSNGECQPLGSSPQAAEQILEVHIVAYSIGKNQNSRFYHLSSLLQITVLYGTGSNFVFAL